MAKKAKRSTDAITVLKDDHKKVKALLASLEKTTEKSAERRTKLLGQIEAEINVHATIEEEIFYPAYREAVKKKDDVELYQEALEEHHVVDLIMPELKASDPGGEIFGAKATVLKEVIEHHADEEEKEMFKKARAAMDKAELLDLGSRHPRAQEAAQGGRDRRGKVRPRDGPDRRPDRTPQGTSWRRRRAPAPRRGPCGGGSGAGPAPLPCCRTPRPPLRRA